MEHEMTEKRTLALSGRQWRVLLHDNLDVLKAIVQQTEAIDEQGLRNICTQLDDMKMLAVAWYKAGVPIPKKLEVPQELIVESVQHVKKRRGRPPKAAQAQAMQ